MRGQYIRSAWAKKHSDHAHARPTLCHGVACIFLTALLSYDAVALPLGQCEKLLRYGKLATSSYSLQLPLDQSAQQKHTLSRNQPPHSPTGHALHQAPPLCLTAQCQATAAYPATPTDNRMSLLWFLTV